MKRIMVPIVWWIFLFGVGICVGYSIPHRDHGITITPACLSAEQEKDLITRTEALTDIVAEQLIWEKKIAREVK